MRPDVAIEAVLFYKTEPVGKGWLGEFLGMGRPEIDTALAALAERLALGATRLIDTGEEVQLVSAPEVSEIVERLRTEELSREIGKAGAETLAIVLFRSPVSRAQIDYIRGVNSSYILRALSVRGLVERAERQSSTGRRSGSYHYAATPALFAYLGIARKEDLPGYARVMDEIDRFEKTTNAEGTEAEATAG